MRHTKIPDISLYYGFADLRPTAQRLREQIGAFKAWGYDAVYVEWGDSFPWSVEPRFQSADAYSEELLSGIVREGDEIGIAVGSVFPAPDELDFVARVGAYRHLFGMKEANAILELAEPAGRKLYADLIEDFLGIGIETDSVLLNWRGWRVPLPSLKTALTLLREQGMAAGIRWLGSNRPSDEVLSSLASDCAFIVAPPGALAGQGIAADRIIDRVDAGEGKIVRAGSDEPGGGPARGKPKMICFDPRWSREEAAHEGTAGPESEAGDDARTAGTVPTLQSGTTERVQNAKCLATEHVLSGSIELSLEAVRKLGGAQANGGSETDGLAPPGDLATVRELESELSLTVDRAWRVVRGLREALIVAERRQSAWIGPELERLRYLRGEARRYSRELAERLAEQIRIERLERTLRRVTAALDEEYYLLLARCVGSGVNPEDGTTKSSANSSPP